MKLAYTMGNKKSYDRALAEEPSVSKLGRYTKDDDYYPGGCCWSTYKEALAYIEKNKSEIPYEPDIYGILLPNGWKDDVSNDSYIKKGYNSLLTDYKIIHVSGEDK